MRYLRICIIYAYIAANSLISHFLSLQVIAIPEQNYNPGALMLILHKNKISVLMRVNARILLKSAMCHCLHLQALFFILCEPGLEYRTEIPLSFWNENLQLTRLGGPLPPFLSSPNPSSYSPSI